jgi:hypothetical protein
VLYQRPWRGINAIKLSLETFPLGHDSGEEVRGKGRKGIARAIWFWTLSKEKGARLVAQGKYIACLEELLILRVCSPYS